jgi:hypothetical protein
MVIGCTPQVPESQSGTLPQPGTLRESAALAIARRTLATNGGPAWLETNVFYRARPDGRGWSVAAEVIVGTNASGEPEMPVGGHRIISIDENGAVTHIMRGR